MKTARNRDDNIATRGKDARTPPRVTPSIAVNRSPRAP